MTGHGLLTGGGSPDRIAAISLKLESILYQDNATSNARGPRKSQSLVNLSREGKGWVGNCSCEVCFLSIFRREKGGNLFFFADPLALEAGLCYTLHFLFGEIAAIRSGEARKTAT